MRLLASALSSLVLIVVVSGCASTPSTTSTPAAVEDVSATETPTDASGAEPSVVRDGAGISGRDLGPEAAPGTPLAQRVIYFEYDQATLQPQYRPVVEAHAEYLRDHSRLIVTLEGHTDPRGTREYNIALGERRAEAVRRIMQLQGVEPQQLEVISYGEERLAQESDTETAWRENRRVVIVYSGERQ
jgi:peptidoglycan-associated lipoprotein